MIFAVLNLQSSLNIKVLSILIPIHIVDNIIDIMYAGNFSVSINSEPELLDVEKININIAIIANMLSATEEFHCSLYFLSSLSLLIKKQHLVYL